MKTRFLLSAACLCVLIFSCAKERITQNSAAGSPIGASDSGALYKEYVITKGEHYCTDNPFKAVDTTELKFTVKFDSSAIYQTADPANQDDINKLWGFADNGAHHQQFSARFGWRWSGSALHLFAYTYNNGVRDSKELSVIPIGKEVHCGIKVCGEAYAFTVNEKTETMPRLSATEKAKGYQLYPYFGGDETAPHEVRIWIREE